MYSFFTQLKKLIKCINIFEIGNYLLVTSVALLITKVHKIEVCNQVKVWVTKTSVIVILVHKIEITLNQGQ